MNKKKYYIDEIIEKLNHAASKARADTRDIVLADGWKPVKMNGFSKDLRINAIILFFKFFFAVKSDSYIFIQYPFLGYSHRVFSYLSAWKKAKKCHFIFLIHDMESIREENLGTSASSANEKRLLELADIIIVHNDSMKNAVEKLQINCQKILVLGIFDYLLEKSPWKNRDTSEGIVFSGNIGKSEFVPQLSALDTKFHLYGPWGNKPENLSSNIDYKGSYKTDEIPFVMDGKYGLVWDGTSIETCSGSFGNYLRYNNPHKTSLYIVSGLPIIAWKESAIGKFVETEKIGFTVESLNEIQLKISQISEIDYNLMQEHEKELGLKLMNGSYLKKVLKEINTYISKC